MPLIQGLDNGENLRGFIKFWTLKINMKCGAEIKIIKYFINKYSGRILSVVIFVVLGQMSLANGSERLLVWPLDSSTASTSANVTLEPYEIRIGTIAISPALLPLVTGTASKSRIIISAGDTFTIKFFDDVAYIVTVDFASERSDGTMIINARINDQKIGTVVLTITPEGFLITLQDLNRSLLYRVTGISGLGTGTVTEINMTKIPQMIR